MQNHKQDSFDGGRAPDLTAAPSGSETSGPAATAPDEVALLMAILSLTGEGDLPWPASPAEMAAPSEAPPLGTARPRWKPDAAS
jgi:hypothetical protein